MNTCKHESWKKRSDRMTVQCQKCGLEADELSHTYKFYIDITDEEIDNLADKFGAGMEQFGGCFRHLDFARAILKKASEK